MEVLKDYAALIVGTVLINNILLAKFLGNCPFLGVSKKMETAFGMAVAVVFVMALSGGITWMVDSWILQPLDIGYVQTLAFILVIAALVQFVELFLKKSVPVLYKALGIYLPLITTNCAVLGAAILSVQEKYSLVRAIVYNTACAVGFGLALLLFAGIRERYEISRIPKALQGTGIGLLSAGLLALTFYAFKGMV